MPFDVIPSIDLHTGQVVRLLQGDYARKIAYEADPLITAKSFADAGARRIHIVDLDGARDGRPVQLELIAKIIASCHTPVQVGGGVRSELDIRRLLDAGADRVVIGTRALEDWTWFEKLAHQPDLAQKIILALDARDGVVATRGWTNLSGQRATDVARQVGGWPLAAILYTDISHDGMMNGPNLDSTAKLIAAGATPVLASGGVGCLDHIRGARQINAAGVIVGRSLYEGAIDLTEALKLNA